MLRRSFKVCRRQSLRLVSTPRGCRRTRSGADAAAHERRPLPLSTDGCPVGIAVPCAFSAYVNAPRTFQTSRRRTAPHASLNSRRLLRLRAFLKSRTASYSPGLTIPIVRDSATRFSSTWFYPHGSTWLLTARVRAVRIKPFSLDNSGKWVRRLPGRKPN
jgi:hypothetical protein